MTRRSSSEIIYSVQLRPDHRQPINVVDRAETVENLGLCGDQIFLLPGQS